MIPLPAALGGTDLFAWRLDQAIFKLTWNSGEGSFRAGGRWNSKGVKAVDCSIDPATAILEVAAHKTFRALDSVPHVLTAMVIHDPTTVHIVQATAVPNANWMRPGSASAGQQHFGDALLSDHVFVLIPSTISTHSWNLIFNAENAIGRYAIQFQEAFALDTRLHPPA